MSHPEIIEAAVIGIPAEKRSDGEVPRAYVILKEGSSLSTSAIHDFIAERLARYKHCVGGIVIGGQIPKSMSGKKLKRLLQEQARQELASERMKSKI